MSKYYKAEDIIKAINDGQNKWYSNETLRNSMLKFLVEDIPSADVVEVVHCKDCKHYVSDGGAIMECEIYEVPTEDNHYCGYGERKDNE